MILCVLPVGIEIRHEFFIPNFKIFYILYQKCFTDKGSFHIVNDNFVCNDLEMPWEGSPHLFMNILCFIPNKCVFHCAKHRTLHLISYSICHL